MRVIGAAFDDVTTLLQKTFSKLNQTSRRLESLLGEEFEETDNLKIYEIFVSYIIPKSSQTSQDIEFMSADILQPLLLVKECDLISLKVAFSSDGSEIQANDEIIVKNCYLGFLLGEHGYVYEGF